MKILWLSHFVPYPEKGGGVKQRSHNLLRQVAKEHDVTLITLNNKAFLPTSYDVEKAIKELKGFCRSIMVYPILYDKFSAAWKLMAIKNFFSSTPYDVKWLTNYDMSKYLKSLTIQAPYDVIHLDTEGLFPYTRYFDGIPIVVNHHNVESHMMSRRAEKDVNKINRIYFKREASKLMKYERQMSKSCKVHVVVSDLDGTRLREIIGNIKIVTVDNGVDVEYFMPRTPLGQGSEGLVFAGGMSWYPNRDAVLYILCHIWPALLTDNPARRITIVGANPLKELKDAANRDSRITAPGFVDDVRPYLDRASIYICPIRDGGGTRLKILDALAMAKPIVATGLAVEGLGLKEDEHYVRAESPQEFVYQITRLENDYDLRKKLARSGRNLVEEKFTWKRIGENLKAAYELALQ